MRLVRLLFGLWFEFMKFDIVGYFCNLRSKGWKLKFIFFYYCEDFCVFEVLFVEDMDVVIKEECGWED